MVEAWSRSFVGLYEVESVTAGVGAELKDLIFGGTIFVHDVNMSTRLVRWDGLLVRVVPGERGTELGGTGVTVPRHNIEPLRAWMDERREEAGLDWASYLKRNWPRIRRHSFELGRDWMQSLQLSNTDGEELLFSKAVYTMADADAVSAALRASPVLEDESDSFVWVNEHKTVLGNIRVAGKELLLECNSRERLDRGKRLLGKLAKKWLRHVRDEFTTQKELKSQAVARPHGTRAQNTGIPNDAEDAAITRMLEDHYRRWPDEGIPALEGKTPREAARTPEGREKLRTLLKDFENGEERKKRGGEPFYDVGRLLVELGLD